jgi:hypothetical protein
MSSAVTVTPVASLGTVKLNRCRDGDQPASGEPPNSQVMRAAPLRPLSSFQRTARIAWSSSA